ncbi:hemerythrin domain-containing protein [Nocardia higoensis]|uniref:Hemerythrin domain-containing protein n=1 Tax=Nocardia higoensis TaxID=228599 RepID=A0ABS0D3N3_9NOCA|nr:hemerythrin domain-containing protein [Nocardia higoensis]MBF6353092.1 hemerythrin domain-containing protein [Nocardia higoensis]
MNATTAPARPDTYDMVVVHNSFRRHFRALPDLVTGVAAGDLQRARRLVAFLDELGTGLHEHHTGEDELLWPLLLERASTDAALVLRMEEQHERIAELTERARRESAEFASAADSSVRDRLAVTLRALATAVDEHMTEEERQVLPVVENVLTVPEWQALGERGREHMPKDRQLVFFGFLLQGASDADRRKFLAEMPLPARLAWRLLGRRAFAKEYREIYGTDPE